MVKFKLVIERGHSASNHKYNILCFFLVRVLGETHNVLRLEDINQYNGEDYKMKIG